MILRSTLRLVLLLVAAATAAAQTSLVFAPPAGVAAKNKHVVLLSGDEEYRSEEAMPMLAKILSQRHGFKATVLFALDADGTINPENQKSLSDSQALDSADVIVMSLRFRQWPDADMERFDAAYKRGVPIIALRTSTHAFNFPAGSKWAAYNYNAKGEPWVGGFGKAILGETWLTHWGVHKKEATRGVIEASAASEAVLRGVAEVFGDSDVYEAYPPSDAKILLRGQVLKGMKATDDPADYSKPRVTDKQPQPVNSPAMPIAWTRQPANPAGKQNKIFTTTMGAATDLENEGLRRLVVNAVFWATGLDIPTKADVRYVDPFTPKPYGFRGYRYKLTPAHYALGKTVPEGEPMPPPPPKKTAEPAKKSASTTTPATTAPATTNANATAVAQTVPPISVTGAGSSPLAAPTGPVRPSAPANSPLSIGENVAIIGNALADRMQHHGWLETMIHTTHPSHRIVVRNLAFPGDEITTRARSKDFGTPDEWLTRVRAGTIFSFFGYNESFAGQAGLAKFKADLQTFLRDTRAKNYNGVSAPKIVLFSPIAVEKHQDPNIPYDPQINANLQLYTQAMAEVARDQAGVTFVDLFAPSQQLFAEAASKGQSLTINGVHLHEAGEAKLAEKIFPLVFGAQAPASNTPEFEKLRAAVNAKSTMWHSRYRTVDGYNIYGDRSKIAYVSHPDQPKITNTQIMMEEMAQRDVMTANLDRRAWAIASGSTTPPEVLPLPVVTSFGTNKPGSNPDGTYPFVDGDEAIKLMTVAPGLKVNLFASEKQFPELAKAVQFNWDTKGRLWVAVWPSYPELTPTAKIKDKIIILEDTDKDGRADKCTTWLDGLNCPTGFQFFKDGILVMQAPDLWFVRDTDGDGKGDWKERVVMGLDSADSHHTANSLIYEPGGAILLSDGVFHRSQVETTAGAVRNTDGALYRYEPLSHRFERYVAYAFANPHGRAFDYWGQDIITDATGNNTYFGPAFSGKLDFPGVHPRLQTIWNRPSRPSAGSIILTTTQFPEEYWGNYLNPNVIGFQGVYRVKLTEDGSGIKGIRQTDILQSKDFNFRPIDLSVGPDGALYLVDWHNPLIGHLQSHLRDSNRDHEHGRIYRITAEGRPLAWQPKIDGESIPALLKLLERKENHIRNLAKTELGKHDAQKVIAATKTWLAGLDPKGPDYEHHLLEALWIHQWHNVVDLALLDRATNSSAPGARAAAARVISYWRERVPNALATLRRLAKDENANVRLHAVRAASFFSVPEATEVALAATKQKVDYYLDYVIGETLRQLRPVWRKTIGEGAALAGGDPAATKYLLRTLSVGDLLKMPRSPEVSENILGRAGVGDSARAEALAALAKHRNQPPAAILLATLNSPAEIDVRGVGRLLLAQKPDDLKPLRADLIKLGSADDAPGRTYAWAAAAIADGSLEQVWQEASGSPLSLAALLGGIPMIPDAKLKASAYERAMEILAKPITEIPGPDYIVNQTQRDAMRVAVVSKRESAAVFAAVVKMIERGYQLTAAAAALRDLPRTAWTPEGAATAARAITAWASKSHANERTARDYVETLQVADELTALMPAADADPLRETLKGVRVPVYVIRTVHEAMKYDTPRIVVPAGRAFEIIFDNPDVMPHNLVVVNPGTREKVGNAAMALPPDNLDRQGRAWVPESIDIVAATKMLETGQSETLRMRAIRDEGTYEFVCTFPGHWLIMYGQIVVTKDVEAYIKANPLPSAAAAKPAADHTPHKH